MTVDIKTPEEHEAAVKAGMEWLDSIYPGWEGKLDLDGLYMHDPSCCVLGQLAGDSKCMTGYDAVWKVVWASSGLANDRQAWLFVCRWMQDHGFLSADHYWIPAIKERFDSGELSGMVE